jgi:hypothetical protein
MSKEKQPNVKERSEAMAETSSINDAKDAATSLPTPAFPTVTIDWRLYEQELTDPTLSDAEKRAFIESLWYIVVTFVDLGFGIESAQRALGSMSETQRISCDQQDQNAKALSNIYTSQGGQADG